MSAGIAMGAIEIVVLLGACTLVIALLRNPKWLKWVAIPVGLLVLLGAISIVVALVAHSAPNHRAEIRAAHVEQMSQSYDPVYETFNSNARPFQRVMTNGGGHRSADAVLMEHVRMQQEQTQVRYSTWAKLGIIGLGGLFLFGVLLAILIAARHWIARNKGIAIPLFAVGGVFAILLAAGLPFVVYLRSMQSAEDARRAAIVNELRAIGESLHRESMVPEPGLPPAPLPVPVVKVDVAVDASSVEQEQPAESATSSSVPAEMPDDPAVAATTEASPAIVELPDWVRDAESHYNEFDRSPVVLASDQWATIQESETQLERLAAVAIARQLQARGTPTPGWLPSNDFVHQTGAIQQRFVEETSFQFGEFKSPMYRSYWQVAATPAVSDLAVAQWKAVTVDQRLGWLGAGTVGVTLLFALIAAALRIDAATSGGYRRHLFAAIGFITTFGAAMFLLS